MAAKRADHAQCGRRRFQMILFVFVLPKKAMNFMYHLKSSLRTSLEIALSVKGFEMGVMPLRPAQYTHRPGGGNASSLYPLFKPIHG
jgi:hypothetical protein